jgi:hypothetical protein
MHEKISDNTALHCKQEILYWRYKTSPPEKRTCCGIIVCITFLLVVGYVNKLRRHQKHVIHHPHAHVREQSAVIVVTQRRCLLCYRPEAPRSQFLQYFLSPLSQPCKEGTMHLSGAIYLCIPCGRHARREVLVDLRCSRTLTSRCSRSAEPRQVNMSTTNAQCAAQSTRC